MILIKFGRLKNLNVCNYDLTLKIVIIHYTIQKILIVKLKKKKMLLLL